MDAVIYHEAVVSIQLARQVISTCNADEHNTNFKSFNSISHVNRCIYFYALFKLEHHTAIIEILHVHVLAENDTCDFLQNAEIF